jgi:Cdc6-like AAA superfamily ATPase
MTAQSSFVAYPGSPKELSSTIEAAVEYANRRQSSRQYKPWIQSDIAGRMVVQPVLDGISESALFVADVTRLNFNVTYEIGYAIGLQKRALLIRNSSITSDDELILKTGIFDTIGYETYGSTEQLGELLFSEIDLAPMRISAELDRNAPVFVLEVPHRTDAMTRIIARVKRASLFYRSFAPSEDARLSAVDAMRWVSGSMGILVPLISTQYVDANVHNIRAAFVAGLSHGMEKCCLILHDGSFQVPIDLRDAVDSYMSLDQIDDHISTFAASVYKEMQSSDGSVEIAPGLLQSISLGDPLAENEYRTLSEYYVQTDQYNRALRGEINLVVGRKGTGKTALFFQVRDRVRNDRRNVVIDLKPEGYQLLKLKEHVLDYLSDGAKAHLITAFWEYLLLLEITKKVLDKDRRQYKYDHTIAESHKELTLIYGAERNVSAGDFSERLLTLSEDVIAAFRERYSEERDRRLATDEVTNLLHIKRLGVLKKALANYLSHKEMVLVLFDNLDRGWKYTGVGRGDVLILRCLIDASRKIQRDMRKAHLEFSSIVFIRNDIYQLLVKTSSDFGKESRASLDWNDEDLLREVLRRRLVRQFDADTPFSRIWGKVCCSHYDGEETSQFMISRCMMRPRYLLKLFGHCIGSAVNLHHETVNADDIEKGYRSYSGDIIIEAGRELTDIEPATEGLLYEFVGEQACIERGRLIDLFTSRGIDKNLHVVVCEYLLYFGILGLLATGKKPIYIYDVRYDMGILQALMRKNMETVKYLMNPALWPVLSIIDNTD